MVNAQRTRYSKSRASRSMAIYCVAVHNQPQYIVPEIFVQNVQIHRPVWNHYILWLMKGVKYDILENARYGARRFGSVRFYRQPVESEIPRFSPATRVMCAVCGIVRWGEKGWNIAVSTVSIRIQDIVDIQNRLQDIGSTQDIVPSYSMAYKIYPYCLGPTRYSIYIPKDTQDEGLRGERAR